MNPLILEKQPNTLKVVLDKEKKEFVFEGRSLPENTVKFFEPVMTWIREYQQDPLDEIEVHMIGVQRKTNER